MPACSKLNYLGSPTKGNVIKTIQFQLVKHFEELAKGHPQRTRLLRLIFKDDEIATEVAMNAFNGLNNSMGIPDDFDFEVDDALSSAKTIIETSSEM